MNSIYQRVLGPEFNDCPHASSVARPRSLVLATRRSRLVSGSAASSAALMAAATTGFDRISMP